MKQIFYMIRHGETDWNVQRKLQGHSNISLNQMGLQQAQRLALRFQPVHITQLFASDLSRAKETAHAAWPHHHLSIHPELREVYLGEAEGRTREETSQLWGESLWESWNSLEPEKLHERFPQGESRAEALVRLRTFLDRQMQFATLNFEQSGSQKTDARMAFVSHGLLMRTLLHSLIPEKTETCVIDNCGVLKLSWQSDKAGTPGQFEVLNYFDQNSPIKD